MRNLSSKVFIFRKGLEEFFENGKFLSLHNVDHSIKKPYFHGRPWSASELRRKSFDDLHKLWYVLLKEKNLLFTQQTEATRLGLHWLEEDRLNSVHQSMARIKGILTERKNAFQEARKCKALEGASELEVKKVRYIDDIMRIKKEKHGFRRLLRFILRKHPHFDWIWL